jgi:hypothetical protein
MVDQMKVKIGDAVSVKQTVRVGDRFLEPTKIARVQQIIGNEVILAAESNCRYINGNHKTTLDNVEVY